MGRILNKDIQVKNTQDPLAARTFLQLLSEHDVVQFEWEFCTGKAGMLQGEQGNFSSERSIRMWLWDVPRGWKSRCEILKNPALNVLRPGTAGSNQCVLEFLNFVLLVCKEKKFGDASASPPALTHPWDYFKFCCFPQCPFV